MNKFDVKANKLERAFFRKIKNGSFFYTGNGKQNNIVGFTNTKILFKTQDSNKPISITRNKLKKAISFILYKRTATREDLEQFSNFNSALMGLLQVMLIGMAKINKTGRGLLRLSLKGVRFFFSGLDKPTKEDLNTIIENGGSFILNSYYWLRERNVEGWMEKLKKNNIKLLIDSGAYSVYNAREKEKKIIDSSLYEVLSPKEKRDPNIVRNITVEDYAHFINTYKHLIYGFFNLDVIGDPVETAANFKKLKELTGMSPIPVWPCHVEDWRKSDFDMLDNLVQGNFDIIGIGGTVALGKKAGPSKQDDTKRELFEEIFKRHPMQNFHWLGGSSNLLFEFPFFSADSSGWLQGRRDIRQIYTFEPEQATRRMPLWSKKKCLAYNVRALSGLEQLFSSGIQLTLDDF